MNKALKEQVNHYEGNLSRDDQSINFLVPYNKKFANKHLYLHTNGVEYYRKNYDHIYHNKKGLSRLLVRSKEFGYFYLSDPKDTVIANGYLKEIFFDIAVLKNGSCYNIRRGELVSPKRFRKFKKNYEMGFVDADGIYTEKYYKVTKPRASRERLYEYFKQFIDEFNCEGEPEGSYTRKFIEDLLKTIKEFPHDRIGKIYVDFTDGLTNPSRAYLHKEGLIDVFLDYYDVVDEIGYIIFNLEISQNSNYEIKISKNR